MFLSVYNIFRVIVRHRFSAQYKYVYITCIKYKGLHLSVILTTSMCQFHNIAMPRFVDHEDYKDTKDGSVLCVGLQSDDLQ